MKRAPYKRGKSKKNEYKKLSQSELKWITNNDVQDYIEKQIQIELYHVFAEKYIFSIL